MTWVHRGWIWPRTLWTLVSCGGCTVALIKLRHANETERCYDNWLCRFCRSPFDVFDQPVSFSGHNPPENAFRLWNTRDFYDTLHSEDLFGKPFVFVVVRVPKPVTFPRKHPETWFLFGHHSRTRHHNPDIPNKSSIFLCGCKIKDVDPETECNRETTLFLTGTQNWLSNSHEYCCVHVGRSQISPCADYTIYICIRVYV